LGPFKVIYHMHIGAHHPFLFFLGVDGLQAGRRIEVKIMLQGTHYVQINSFTHKGLTFNLPFCSYLKIRSCDVAKTLLIVGTMKAMIE